MINRFNTPNFIEGRFTDRDGKVGSGYIWHLAEGEMLPQQKEPYGVVKVINLPEGTNIDNVPDGAWDNDGEWQTKPIEGPCSVIARCYSKKDSALSDITNPPWRVLVIQPCDCDGCAQEREMHGRLLLAPEKTLFNHMVASARAAQMVSQLTGTEIPADLILRHQLMLEYLPWASGVKNDAGEERPTLREFFAKTEVSVKGRAGEKDAWVKKDVQAIYDEIDQVRDEMERYASGEIVPVDMLERNYLLKRVGQIGCYTEETAPKEHGHFDQNPENN